jgi:hypothetical protein
MCIEGKFPDKPLDTVYLGLYILDTEILAIEDHKLNSTLFHVAFKSQSLLKPTGD